MEILVYNDKTASMRKEFFQSVDEANLKREISFKNSSVVLIIHYISINVFVLSILGYEIFYILFFCMELFS